jgi:Na+/H+ antiporter NhaA
MMKMIRVNYLYCDVKLQLNNPPEKEALHEVSSMLHELPGVGFSRSQFIRGFWLFSCNNYSSLAKFLILHRQSFIFDFHYMNSAHEDPDPDVITCLECSVPGAT